MVLQSGANSTSLAAALRRNLLAAESLETVAALQKIEERSGWFERRDREAVGGRVVQIAESNAGVETLYFDGPASDDWPALAEWNGSTIHCSVPANSSFPTIQPSKLSLIGYFAHLSHSGIPSHPRRFQTACTRNQMFSGIVLFQTPPSNWAKLGSFRASCSTRPMNWAPCQPNKSSSGPAARTDCIRGV